MSPATQKPSGIFITLEGGEGSGKTTQARRLCDWLTTQGWQVLHTREPGGTLLAERVRGLLLDHSAEAIAPETEAWLILAARRQHVDHVIKPALQQGMIVVCDRFSDSTIAYQGYGRGLDLRVLRTMNKWATGKLVPHLTLLFDVPVRVGLRRRRSQRASQNRIDREATQFHEKVRAGFRTLARQEPRRMVVFDASLPLESVQQHVVTFITRWFKRRGIQQLQQR
ncbi:MAG: dTMP kinase [Nitrospira sp.]|nr:dTMP kinase [Nitrospira sp.]MDH5193021.1 dTMP kinase [Nitrospira sp.]